MEGSQGLATDHLGRRDWPPQSIFACYQYLTNPEQEAMKRQILITILKDRKVRLEEMRSLTQHLDEAYMHVL